MRHARPHAKTPNQTRRSDAVKRRHRGQGPPLPMHLQIHPPYKSRLPLHPGCGYDLSSWGKQMLLKDYTDAQLRGGVGLSRVRTRYEVRIAGKIAGYTDDPHYGLAFAREAKERGMDAGMFTIDTADLVRTKEEGE